MGLYKRDYNVLTVKEQKQLKEALDYQKSIYPNLEVSDRKFRSLLPIAYDFYNSYFPNNYFDEFVRLDDLEKSSLINTIEGFVKLLDSEKNEREILNFINQNYYYGIIGSLFLTEFNFGHHDSYIFKEFELSSSFRVDYLLIGKNSHGYHFIFVELESPSGTITKNDGSFGSTLRKGIKQVQDWDEWLESNFISLSSSFDKYRNTRKDLPKEFFKLDKTKLNYVVVAGRRKDFNEKTRREKRNILKYQNIKILHYDNLVDNFKRLYRI